MGVHSEHMIYHHLHRRQRNWLESLRYQLWLRCYRFEVTMCFNVLTPGEKFVCYFLMLAFLAGSSFVLYRFELVVFLYVVPKSIRSFGSSRPLKDVLTGKLVLKVAVASGLMLETTTETMERAAIAFGAFSQNASLPASS
jgi:hypothetical protein